MKDTTEKCRHCSVTTGTGIRGGCYQCGKVKHNASGRKNPKKASTTK